MTIRQVILVRPINISSLLHLKEQGYNLYAQCEGIQSPVQIRGIRLTRSEPRDQVEIGHWGYHWVAISKLVKVTGSRLEPDQGRRRDRPR